MPDEEISGNEDRRANNSNVFRVLVHAGLNVPCRKGSEYEKAILSGLKDLVVHHGLTDLELCFLRNNSSFSKLMENFVSYGVRHKKINPLVLGTRQSSSKKETDGNRNRVLLAVSEAEKVVIFHWDSDQMKKHESGLWWSALSLGKEVEMILIPKPPSPSSSLSSSISGKINILANSQSSPAPKGNSEWIEKKVKRGKFTFGRKGVAKSISEEGEGKLVPGDESRREEGICDGDEGEREEEVKSVPTGLGGGSSGKSGKGQCGKKVPMVNLSGFGTGKEEKKVALELPRVRPVTLFGQGSKSFGSAMEELEEVRHSPEVPYPPKNSPTGCNSGVVSQLISFPSVPIFATTSSDEEGDLDLDLEGLGIAPMPSSNVLSLVTPRGCSGTTKRVGFDLCPAYATDRRGKKRESEEEFGLLGSFSPSGNAGIPKTVSVMTKLNEKQY